MTDNEIIKALECCSTAQNCTPCKYEPNEYEKGTVGCCNELMKNAIDLIKRQQAEIAELSVLAEKNNDKLNSVIDCQKAEIERLTGYNSNLVFANQGILHTLETEITKAKSEAITEFAERLKDMHKHNTTSVVSLVTLFGDINKMVKEMTEDINDT